MGFEDLGLVNQILAKNPEAVLIPQILPEKLLINISINFGELAGPNSKDFFLRSFDKTYFHKSDNLVQIPNNINKNFVKRTVQVC